MRVIDLVIKDLTQTVRDWKAAAFVLVMPIIFTLLIGALFGNSGGGQDPRLPVGLLDQDNGSVLSANLETLMDSSDAIRPVLLEGQSLDEVESQIGEELVAAAIIPSGYSERILAGGEASLTIIVDSSAAGDTAQRTLQTAVTRLLGSVQAAQLSAQAYTDLGGDLTSDAARDEFLTEALLNAIEAWEDPPVTVDVRQQVVVVEEESTTDAPTGYAHSSPGMMVQFSIVGITGAATVLVLERKSKSMQRLLTTAISRGEIILGHYLAIFIMTLIQLLALVAFGQLALGLDYMREPIATLLIVITMALWTASLGLLIGVLAKDEEQVIIFSMIPMFVLSALGGAWMPLETAGETFQTIGHLMPTAWSIDGLKNILVRGLGLEAALLPAGIMLAYAIALFALALWRFKFE